MPDDRRYRQQGYRSTGADKREPPRPRADLPRSGGLLDTRAVSRCAACGVRLPVATGSLAECPSCRAVLHACCQCTHFDPGARFECAQPIGERVVDKTARNECASFTLRTTVEREASPGTTKPQDARRGFDNLFRK